MTVKDIFENKIAKRAPEATDIDAVFAFNITGDDGGQWVVDLTGEGTVVEGTSDKADCTIELDADNFKALVSGEAQGAMLFMNGSLKIAGNMGLAMKLGQVLGN